MLKKFVFGTLASLPAVAFLVATFPSLAVTPYYNRNQQPAISKSLKSVSPAAAAPAKPSPAIAQAKPHANANTANPKNTRANQMNRQSTTANKKNLNSTDSHPMSQQTHTIPVKKP
jgi:hypothetical protein